MVGKISKLCDAAHATSLNGAIFTLFASATDIWLGKVAKTSAKAIKAG